MEHHSVMKRNDLLIHTTTWMDPKGIILSGKHQLQITKYASIYITSKLTKSGGNQMWAGFDGQG